jgi:4-aminobutyrate aminotransferase / (S)-3-amino-2-methylpropionate transaminase / 5-aminovalerate transaminase
VTRPVSNHPSVSPGIAAGGPALPQVRRLVTEIPGPRSRALMARRDRVVARGIGTTLPVFVEAAGGAVIVDVDGNSFIDFGAGIAVVNVGNSADRVVAAVQDQVARFTHTCFMVTPYEGYVAVCEALDRLTPGDHEKRSALFNSGAEAVENAVKIARAHTGRSAVVAFDHAYHGRTNLTMALTAKNMPYKHSFGPFAPEVYRMPMSYPYRWPGAAEDSGPGALAQVIDLITKQVGADEVACVILEPIQGEGGFVVPGQGFLPGLAQWCRDNGIVFIADEVQTGFARTGDMFACEDEGVVPDLICLAKGIAGGFPLSAVTGRAEIMDGPHVGGLGGTYGGNPVACAAALATIEAIEQDALVERARHIGGVMLPRLRALQEQHAIIGDVRGRGAMIALELVAGSGDKTPNPAATAAVTQACHAAGLLTLTAGTFGNVLRFLPPLVISDELLDEGLTILEKAFAQVAADGVEPVAAQHAHATVDVAADIAP